MADKYLKTRLALKYDTLANWNAHDPLLLKGEIAIVALPEGVTESQVKGTTPPQILIKVGDGENKFKALKWASGMAADVYDWAKAAAKPSYAASEINGLQKFVEDHSDFNTNTTYQIIAGSKTGMYQLQKKELNGGWTNEGDEFGVDEAAIKSLITAAQNKANSAYTLAEGKLGKTEKAADSAKLNNQEASYYATASSVTDLGKNKADKIEAIGTVAAVIDHANQISVKAVSGEGKTNTITINDVAHATKADNLGDHAASEYQLAAELGALAKKDNVSEAELEATLKTKINGKADTTTVNAIDERVKTAKGEIDTLQGYFENGVANKAKADANGKDIVATYETKENVTSGLAGKLDLHAKADDSAKLEGKTKEEVIAEARTGYATTTYVDNKVAGSVQYLGIAKALTDLNVDPTTKEAVTVGKGDFYRAGADFEGVSSGDLIVALKDNPKQLINDVDYAVVKSSDDYKGTVTSVVAGGGLTGGEITESGTIAHAAGNAANKGEGFYKISTDAYSHVNSVKAVGAEDITGALGYTPYDATNPNGYTTNKGTVTSVTVTGNNGLTGTGTINENGTITLSHAEIEAPKVVEGGKGRTYITELVADGKGHITGYKTATETDQAHQAIKTLNTNNTSAQVANAAEEIKGDGVINLHKIAKTGSYNDLNDKPTIGNGTFTVSASGEGLTGSGSMTANQTGASTAELAIDFDVVAKKSDLPTVNNGTFTVKGDGTSITGTGSMTANQANTTEATLAVNDYANIISAKNAGDKFEKAGNIVTEGGDTIIFCCGDSIC